jgi:drug/metabolite transporter (DMT)-like permease
MPDSRNRPSRWLLVLAFACVYIVWGSSYIGISFAIETIPPTVMTATRFILAGGVLIVMARAQHAAMPTRAQWRSGFIAGGLLFLANNGLIVLAAQMGLPTGVSALLVGTTPMWMVILTSAQTRVRPNVGTIAGLALGTLGIGLLVNLNGALAGGASELAGAVTVILAAMFWAVGSLYARGADMPPNPLMSTGIQLFCGGLLQAALSIANGSLFTVDFGAISLRSVAAMIYLAIFASIIAFTAFTWLMRVANPALVTTYAYVNPIVAVILGWLLRGEQLTVRTLAAGAIIIAAVVILSRASRAAPAPRSIPTPPVESVPIKV